MSTYEALPLSVDRETASEIIHDRPPRRRKVGVLTPAYVASRAVTYVIMAVTILLTVYPLIWMVLGGFKSGSEFYANIWGLPSSLDFSNFVYSWNAGNLGQKFINSIVVTLGTMALVLPITSMAGYALAKIRFRGRRAIYVFILLGIMVPFGVIAIPVFTVIVDLGLLNTLVGLVLVYTANAIPLGVFLMYSFFESIPDELEEAAQVDGCSPFGAFFRIILPLARPGLATQVILTGTSVWNEYFMASLLIHQDSLQTLPLGLVIFTSRFGTNYPQLFAALTIVTLPMIILYLSAQKQFISGLAAGAVKG
ncbi:MAG: binding-protein-dependent transport system inner rane component [Rhodoglobus sp.]|nr:binding-protein-dependent transport system inner rane component [Rhodoglobus sp.]